MEQYPDFSVMLQLAQSEAGQKLIALLQKNGGSALECAIAKAAAGDFEAAKEQISSLLAGPEAQELVKELSP